MIIYGTDITFDILHKTSQETHKTHKTHCTSKIPHETQTHETPHKIYCFQKILHDIRHT